MSISRQPSAHSLCVARKKGAGLSRWPPSGVSQSERARYWQTGAGSRKLNTLVVLKKFASLIMGRSLEIQPFLFISSHPPFFKFIKCALRNRISQQLGSIAKWLVLTQTYTGVSC